MLYFIFYKQMIQRAGKFGTLWCYFASTIAPVLLFVPYIFK